MHNFNIFKTGTTIQMRHANSLILSFLSFLFGTFTFVYRFNLPQLSSQSPLRHLSSSIIAFPLYGYHLRRIFLLGGSIPVFFLTTCISAFFWTWLFNSLLCAFVTCFLIAIFISLSRRQVPPRCIIDPEYLISPPTSNRLF